MSGGTGSLSIFLALGIPRGNWLFRLDELARSELKGGILPQHKRRRAIEKDAHHKPLIFACVHVTHTQWKIKHENKTRNVDHKYAVFLI